MAENENVEIEMGALGVEPEWAWKRRRIAALSEAMQRQIGTPKPKYDLIQKWSSEIDRLSWDLKSLAEDEKKTYPQVEYSQLLNKLSTPNFLSIPTRASKADWERVIQEHKELSDLIMLIPGLQSPINLLQARDWIENAKRGQECVFEKSYQVGDRVEFLDCHSIKRIGRISEEKHVFDIVDEISGAHSTVVHSEVPLQKILGHQPRET